MTHGQLVIRNEAKKIRKWIGLDLKSNWKPKSRLPPTEKGDWPQSRKAANIPDSTGGGRKPPGVPSPTSRQSAANRRRKRQSLIPTKPGQKPLTIRKLQGRRIHQQGHQLHHHIELEHHEENHSHGRDLPKSKD